MRERLVLLAARHAAAVHRDAVRVRQLAVAPAQLQRQQVLFWRARTHASLVRAISFHVAMLQWLAAVFSHCQWAKQQLLTGTSVP